MTKKQFLRRIPALLALSAILSVLLPLLRKDSPDPYRNDFAQADVSMLDQGAVSVRWSGGGEARVKVQITKEEGTDYNYDLRRDGQWERFTLTQGDGEYTLRVLEHTREQLYRPVFSCSLTLALADPAAPFRLATQRVPFTAESPVSLLAARLARETQTQDALIEAVFDYVADSLTYDEEKAAATQPGYLPDPDLTLEQGKGICFDYAALMAAMLRSQGVACKLAVGYAGKQYHAWAEVPGPSGEWEVKDPTFVSANRGNRRVLDFVSDPGNYRVKYYY